MTALNDYSKKENNAIPIFNYYLLERFFKGLKTLQKNVLKRSNTLFILLHFLFYYHSYLLILLVKFGTLLFVVPDVVYYVHQNELSIQTSMTLYTLLFLFIFTTVLEIILSIQNLILQSLAQKIVREDNN